MENIHEDPPFAEEELLEEEAQRKIIAALTEGLRPGEHPYNLRRALESFEKEHLKKVLDVTEHDLPQTAKLLGISTKSLATRMKKHGLD